MHFGQPNKKDLPRYPHIFKRSAKIAFSVVLVLFLSGYQPTFGFPPVKQSTVNAQENNIQSMAIESKELPFSFQELFPGYISQHYTKWHPALDIATGLGMPIKPITGGTVVSAGYDFFGYGLKVEIDHGQGYRSLYAHMGKIYVKEGDKIESTSYLGEVGLTGRTTGPHTHLEVLKDGATIDPEKILPVIAEYADTSHTPPIGGK